MGAVRKAARAGTHRAADLGGHLLEVDSQPSFDLEREQTHPDWGDPTWRSIPATATAEGIGVAHLHINDEDLLADPEIALPMHLLAELVDEGVIGGAVAEHVSVMGFQERSLREWQKQDGAGACSSPARPGGGRSHPRPGLTRLLRKRARAGTMDRGGGDSDRGRDDDAFGG